MLHSHPSSLVLSLPQQRFQRALRQKKLFKLIGGGSLTEARRVGPISAVYAMAGAQCVDVAPNRWVVEAVKKAFNGLPSSVERPLLMVSLPLDPDPHFRKMHVDDSACTGCDACTPTCPTEALAVDESTLILAVEQPLCYGCGRCVPVCPTQALSMSPHHPDAADVLPVLRDPHVEAVEIHSGFADEALIDPFMATYGEALQGKQLAICFQAGDIAPQRWLPFVARWIEIQAQVLPAARLVVQVDGRPMSGGSVSEVDINFQGNNEPPAITAARILWQHLSPHQRQSVDVMLSGGVDGQTADAVRQSGLFYVGGIGMGTVARQAVWNEIDQQSEALFGDVVQGEDLIGRYTEWHPAVQAALCLVEPILQGLVYPSSSVAPAHMTVSPSSKNPILCPTKSCVCC